MKLLPKVGDTIYIVGTVVHVSPALDGVRHIVKTKVNKKCTHPHFMVYDDLIALIEEPGAVECAD